MRESTGALTFFFFLRKPSTFPLHPTRVVWIDKIVRNLLLSFIKVRIYRLVPRVCGFTTSPRVHLCAPAAAVTSSLFGYASHFLKGQSRCFPLIYWPFLANLSPPPVPLSFLQYCNGMEREICHMYIYIFYFYMDIRRCMQSWLCVSSCPPDLLRPSINWAGAVLTPRSLLRPLLSSPLSLFPSDKDFLLLKMRRKVSASSVVFIPTLKESRLFPLIAGKIKIKSLEISGNREGAERERERIDEIGED